MLTKKFSQHNPSWLVHSLLANYCTVSQWVGHLIAHVLLKKHLEKILNLSGFLETFFVVSRTEGFITKLE